TPPTPALEARLATFGVPVETLAVDVADAAALGRALAHAHPVAGVVHAAGVLDDALAADHDEERIARVLRPKVDGARALVEVAPEARPPVCKILDYGKFKYEEKKKKAKASKRQHVQELKEVRMRPLTGAHDLETKLKHAREFLEQGDKVLFTIRFRGREQAHKEIGREVMGKISRALEDIAKVEHAISQMGPHMHMTLMPKPGLKPKPKPEKAAGEAPKAPAKGLSQGIDVPPPTDGDGKEPEKGKPDVQP
ncbi:MAG TPA: translation initiation factor IF-3, partial [Planctomycetota bacterium]|nr:translation initiation factor IF-3 [Planctomycetota bacterium]